MTMAKRRRRSQQTQTPQARRLVRRRSLYLTLLIGCLLLISAIGLVIYREQAPRPPTLEELIAASDRAFEQLDLQLALAKLKQAAALAPNDPTLRLRLGRLYLHLDQPATAERELNAAREFGVARIEWLPLLAEALYEQGNFEELSEMARIAGQAEPELRLIALALEWLGHHGSGDRPAGAMFQRLLEKEPNSRYALLGSALSRARVGEGKRAIEISSALVAEASLFALGWLTHAQLLHEFGSSEQALAAFDRAIALRPANAQARIARGELLVNAGELERASQDLQRAIKQSPKSATAHLLMARVALILGNTPEAMRSLESALEWEPEQYGANLLLGALSLIQSELNRAERLLSKAAGAEPERPAPKKLVALARYRLNDMRGVVTELEPIAFELEGDALSRFILGMALVKTGEFSEGSRYLEELVDDQPSRLTLSIRDELLGGFAATLNEKVSLPSRITETTLLEILADLRRGARERVLNRLQTLLDKEERNADLRALAGEIYLHLGEPTSAVRALESALALEPSSLRARLSLARAVEQRGDIRRAYALYSQIISDERAPRAVIGLADLLIAQGHGKEARENLERIWRSGSHDLGLARRLITQAWQANEPEWAMQLAEQTAIARPTSRTALNLLGEAQQHAGRYPEAVTTFKRLVELKPDSPRALAALAEAQIKTGALSDAASTLERARELHPDAIPVALAELRLLVERGEPDRAQRALDALLRTYPQRPELRQIGEALLANATRQ